MVFLGGAVLGDIMKDKESFWLSRSEYQERGLANIMEKFGVNTSWAMEYHGALENKNRRLL